MAKSCIYCAIESPSSAIVPGYILSLPANFSGKIFLTLGLYF